jgi:hypothetical protein
MLTFTLLRLRRLVFELQYDCEQRNGATAAAPI